MGNLEGGLRTGDFERRMKVLRDGGRLCRKGSGDGHLSSQGPRLGNMERGSFTRDFERWMKGALEVQRLFLRELCGRNVEGGLLYCGPWRICRKGSGDGDLSPYGPAGELGRGLVYREL